MNSRKSTKKEKLKFKIAWIRWLFTLVDFHKPTKLISLILVLITEAIVQCVHDWKTLNVLLIFSIIRCCASDLGNPWLIAIIVLSCLFFVVSLFILLWFCCYCCYRGNESMMPTVVRRIVRVRHPVVKQEPVRSSSYWQMVSAVKYFTLKCLKNFVKSTLNNIKNDN